MHIFTPQKISLFEYLHNTNVFLSAEDKKQIAVNLARGMHALQSVHQPPAHTHLSSKNVMLNPSDLEIFISDYNLKSMKKFCKLFTKYQNITQWTAVEIWNDPKQDFWEVSEVDVFSFGIILWELETGEIPFEGLELNVIKSKLVDERVRPFIREETDKALATLIRSCW